MSFTETITVEIGNIEVDTKSFSFDYKVTRNGVLIYENSYEDDHVWEDLEKFESLLKNGYAVELAIDQVL